MTGQVWRSVRCEIRLLNTNLDIGTLQDTAHQSAAAADDDDDDGGGGGGGETHAGIVTLPPLITTDCCMYIFQQADLSVVLCAVWRLLSAVVIT